MKKNLVLFVVAVATATLMLTSCSSMSSSEADNEDVQNNSVTNNVTTQEENSGDNEAATAEISGTETDLGYMTITIMDGWKSMEITNGIQIYKGNEVLQIDLQGSGVSEDYVKTFIETSINNNGGTEMVTVNLWGEDFLGTTYKSGSYDQIVYARLFNTDGQMLVVKLAGVTADSIPSDIQAMMDSVVFK